jgi:hypothetical protein
MQPCERDNLPRKPRDLMSPVEVALCKFSKPHSYYALGEINLNPKSAHELSVFFGYIPIGDNNVIAKETVVGE